MKLLKNLLLVTFIITALYGCNFFQSDEEEGNLINIETLNEGSWIGFTGEQHTNSEFTYSESINYNPMNDYNLNRNAYVSYFNDEEFIRTVQHSGGELIDTESDANNIIISFNQDRIDSIELIRE